MNKKRIFTFWEPKTNLPAYLKLCMQTWQKFLPEYEVVILDYTNLDSWLGKNFFDESLFKNFSLPKQADAIRCAVLKKYGGIWMDCDTIITSNKVRDFLNLDSNFVLIGCHVAFICANTKSFVLKNWLKGIQFRIKFYKEYHQNSKFSRFCLWLQSPFRYKKIVKNLEGWDFLGNGILGRVLYRVKRKPQEFLSIDKQANNIFPELTEYGTISAKVYQQFYFENDFSEKVIKNDPGIILLHNSWTPKEYFQMEEKEFFSYDNTMSCLLKKILNH